METRIFKSYDSYEGENKETLTAIANDQITKKYNVFGFYKKDEDFEDNLQEYREARNEEFQDFKEENPDFTLSDVKRFLQEFMDEYEYYPQGYTNIYGRPTKFYIYEDQEEYYKDIDYIVGDFFHEDGSPVEESDLNDYIETHEYWDGSNHQEIVLTNEYGHSLYDEVTDQYPNWDEMEQIHYNPGNTGHSNLHLYEDEGGKKHILETVSYYQGVGTFWEELSESQLQEYLLLQYDARTKIEEAEQFIQDYFAADLKKGESIFLEDDEVVFKFKGELYHFSEDELKADANGYKSAVKTARKALQERRKERYAEILKSKFDKLPLNKIFVSIEDSIQAGNCEAHSENLKYQIADAINASGDFSARADQILEFRNDNLAKRAIIRAYINHYA